MASDKLSGLRPVPKPLRGCFIIYKMQLIAPTLQTWQFFSCRKLWADANFFLSQNPLLLRSQSSGTGQREELFHGAPVREGDEPAVQGRRWASCVPWRVSYEGWFLYSAHPHPAFPSLSLFLAIFWVPYAPSIDAQQREKSLNQCCCVLAKGTFQWAGIWSVCFRILDWVCVCVCVCVCAKSLQSCLTLCDPMDYSPTGSFIHGIFQARTLEWVAMPSSRGSSWPRDWIQVSYISCTYRWVLYH